MDYYGTQKMWDALPPEKKSKYEVIHIYDNVEDLKFLFRLTDEDICRMEKYGE